MQDRAYHIRHRWEDQVWHRNPRQVLYGMWRMTLFLLGERRNFVGNGNDEWDLHIFVCIVRDDNLIQRMVTARG